jgi:hypothetical protein
MGRAELELWSGRRAFQGAPRPLSAPTAARRTSPRKARRWPPPAPPAPRALLAPLTLVQRRDALVDLPHQRGREVLHVGAPLLALLLDDAVQVLQRAREALHAGAEAAAELGVLRGGALLQGFELLIKVGLLGGEGAGARGWSVGDNWKTFGCRCALRTQASTCSLAYTTGPQPQPCSSPTTPALAHMHTPPTARPPPAAGGQRPPRPTCIWRSASARRFISASRLFSSFTMESARAWYRDASASRRCCAQAGGGVEAWAGRGAAGHVLCARRALESFCARPPRSCRGCCGL